MMLLALPWMLSEALKLAAGDDSAKIFWFEFQSLWLLPVATASLCFALEYANLNQWLTASRGVLLAVPALLGAALMLTNGSHHLVWLDVSVARGAVQTIRGEGAWVLVAYGFFLSSVTFVTFLWLFVRSPLHRPAAALCLCGFIAVRLGFALDVWGGNPLVPMTATPVGAAFLLATYGLALFRFRLFDIVSIARQTVVEQMHEGILVLDRDLRVVDANPAVEQFLGFTALQSAGREVSALLSPAFPLDRVLGPTGEVAVAVPQKSGDLLRDYAVQRTPLIDSRGLPLGHVFLFRDITEQRRAQEQLLDQQRALAASQERDRVGRELHDGLGQVLGYVKMQIEAARELLSRGRKETADRYLAQAAAVAQDAHADIRDYILAARIGSAEDAPFLASLETYVRKFREQSGIRTELTVDPALEAGCMSPSAEVQLLRIIQEGLTNVRKHGNARLVRVTLGLCDGTVKATVEDDGVGFDVAQTAGGEGYKFGLSFMRERAESLGGIVHIESAQGAGTRVTIFMPLQRGTA